MKPIFEKTFLYFILLYGVCFCLSCNNSSTESPVLASVNQPNEVISESRENVFETNNVENQFSDCNKPNNDDEHLLCAAITRDIDKEMLADLTEELFFVSRRADLNGDGREEVFVWIPTRRWGGSSGYPIIIFSQTSKGYQKLWEIDQAWTPVLLLNAESHGWQDIAFQVGGGGAEWLYIIIKYNGKKYKDSEILEEQPKGKFIIEKNWSSTVFGGKPSQN